MRQQHPPDMKTSFILSRLYQVEDTKFDDWSCTVYTITRQARGLTCKAPPQMQKVHQTMRDTS
jgi:hypothetical protein